MNPHRAVALVALCSLAILTGGAAAQNPQLNAANPDRPQLSLSRSTGRFGRTLGLP